MENKVAENPFKNRGLEPNNNTSFIVVCALFVTLYVVSNVMAVKVIGLWNLFYFDAGTITILHSNVVKITFLAVLYPQISVSTSPSIYAKGKVMVPASK